MYAYLIFADDETLETLVELVLYHYDATLTLYSFAAFFGMINF